MLGSKKIRNLLFRVFSGLRFFFRAQNAHGLHSPFAYEFYCKVLKSNDNIVDEVILKIEKKRKEFISSSEVICGTEYGATGQGKQISERLSDIAKRSLKSPSRAALIARIAALYFPKTILEIGTCLGITTAHLAARNKQAKILTLEGNHARAQQALNLFKEIGISNIQLQVGEFSTALPRLLNDYGQLDVVFIDGNHRRAPTLEYFGMLRNHLHEDSIVIIDDIRWSEEMNQTWRILAADEAVQTSIELFDMGILFFRKDLFRRHFYLRG